ncbi:arylsulfatase [Compostibacter hankyongensis]
MNKWLFLIFISLLLGQMSCRQKPAAAEKPNIIIIYVDDLGYGDVGCYGAGGVSTPNVDLLASKGLMLTDAHATASTCTPSRFSLLTGSYAFRNDAAILPGDAPLLIRPGTPTLPGMLQKAGYTTAVIGKWHLGLGNGTPQWNGILKPGPTEVGFDYSFIVPATLDRVPTVYVENHRVVNLDAQDTIAVSYEHRIGNLPIGLEHPELLKFKADSQHSGTIVDSISRIGFMSGGRSAWWKDEDIADVLVKQMDAFIRKHQKSPFFLYFSLTDIHVPRAPAYRFKGKSTMGSRGDAIAEMDWSTGAVLKTLDALGLTDNTLVIFTSDNGPVLDDGYDDHAEQLVGAHRPGGPFKGGKYSAFEAGTRVPAIVYWPGKIKPGTSNALVSQVDFFASFAALTGQKLDERDAPDSFNMLDALTGKSDTGRTTLLEEAYTFALRSGAWKYIAPQTRPTPGWMSNKKIPTGLEPFPQLYRLDADTAELHNVREQYPDRTAEMKNTLTKIIQDDGTRPGFKKQNQAANR